jgi:para-nitrobenzyl esterase
MRPLAFTPSNRGVFKANGTRIGILLCLNLALASVAANAAPTATVSEGVLTGLSGDGVARFLGVPYAQPPVGPNRWKAPYPPQPWTGVRNATQFGATCPQAATLFGPATANEDCLTLNVYTPEPASTAPRPVLFYIHGGGFWDGSGSYYDASVLARKTDAVVVTINYRLGVFGFLTTSGLTAENRAVNFGLQDQYFALNWVKRNIAAFGGDPGRVTIAGQSAGGAAGCLALTSPKAAGLFHRVIMHSAACAMATTPMSKALAKGKMVSAKAGCAEGAEQMACLRAKPTQVLMAAAAPMTPQDQLSEAIWPATVDGEVIASPVLSALAKGQFHKVPVMLGTTLDEGRGLIGWGFHGPAGRDVTQTEYEGVMKGFAGDLGGSIVSALYPASKHGSVGRAMAAALTDVALACPTHNVSNSLSGHVPTYAFEFADQNAPQFFPDPFMPEGWGAYHMGELLYVFQKPVSGLRFPGLSASQLALSEQMLSYWHRFIATGNPNIENSPDSTAAPDWPRYGKGDTAVQSLRPEGIVTLTEGQYQHAHKCLLWSSYYGLGTLFGMY